MARVGSLMARTIGDSVATLHRFMSSMLRRVFQIKLQGDAIKSNHASQISDLEARSE